MCVILLFNSWILDTRTKFAIASIGVILLGIGIEAMLCFRRKLQKRRIFPRINGLYRRGNKENKDKYLLTETFF